MTRTSPRGGGSRACDRAGPLKIATENIVGDYRIMFRSRQASLLGRKEVFSGKAKFGIFGDGKEAPQVAMARVFRPGDIRAGYYRDQTFMLATGMLTLEQFFAQLYAHADVEADPASAGRQMTSHFATRMLEPDGSWKSISETCNSSADLSPTGSQMPRLVGLAWASKLYRQIDALRERIQFSRNGDEIAFGTIGNASCAEGLFWEAINAIGVLQVPVILSVWDDHYGISVPNEHQITKTEISEVLAGFQRESGGRQGFDVHRVKGWDYAALHETYRVAAEIARRDHVPSIIHVTEMTQPQGHSTSGSHERYKDERRLAWEQEHDCIGKMREWMLEQAFVRRSELEGIEREDREEVDAARRRAWEAVSASIREDQERLVGELDRLGRRIDDPTPLERIAEELRRRPASVRRDLMRAAADALLAARGAAAEDLEPLRGWWRGEVERNRERYGSHLYSETAESALRVPEVPIEYGPEETELRGFEVLNRFFDAALGRDPSLIAFGEDVGQLGDVNQGFAGLQQKYGELRVTDTGIREATILGQAIGMALRGLRPLCEIQYLDYLLYALQILSDDLATLRYRTKGGQKAPVLIRTRGHRLEGIWHSGSPMAGIIHLVRGVYVCVPRDMTRAAGFYNTMLRSDDSALVVEVLNGYRIKERLPANLGEYTMPLGAPEVLREGRDITVVTYGACCRIVLEAAAMLAELGIDAEVIDVQTLLPFDLRGVIVESLKKTGRIVFVDEDVPGGTTAYMLQQVIDEQRGFWWLDGPPRCVSARPHRPAYGSDGDYFSKPSREEIVQAVCEQMHEADPGRYPLLF
jgi:pyruvate/2-oxoglutarate/acetoin dehydrogenase E1 component/TPP-dependent pyruvate/acetoin dehydrogenase alpha subunit